jgi:hypothetical protein
LEEVETLVHLLHDVKALSRISTLIPWLALPSKWEEEDITKSSGAPWLLVSRRRVEVLLDGL